jgi:cell wall-associated NlpC family hydrolase
MGHKRPGGVGGERVSAVIGAACFLLLLPVLVIAAAMGDQQPPPTSATIAAIPPVYLALYEQAAATCPGLPWSVLAAIGTVESDNGQSTAPGVQSGANSAGAEGPMQFLPATFTAYALPVPPGGQQPASPYDPVDAIYAAARDLCADGAGQAATLPAAIYDYNHSTSYVDEVITLAQLLGGENSPDATAAETAVSYAIAQIGTPYQWGGEEPGGFDCSGLTQAAYAAAGIQLPRTAQQQYDTEQPVPAGEPLQSGDLVFFGPDTSHVDHVGIVVSQNEMIDAPHTGAEVRTEPYDWPDYLSAARPSR